MCLEMVQTHPHTYTTGVMSGRVKPLYVSAVCWSFTASMLLVSHNLQQSAHCWTCHFSPFYGEKTHRSWSETVKWSLIKPFSMRLPHTHTHTRQQCTQQGTNGGIHADANNTLIYISIELFIRVRAPCPLQMCERSNRWRAKCEEQKWRGGDRKSGVLSVTSK